MSVSLLEAAVDALGGLADDALFVGAATLALWLTDPAAWPPEITTDVDLVVEITTRPEFHRLEDQLRNRGFAEDQESGILCRWTHPASGVILDVMAVDERVLGFASKWQAAALPFATTYRLPSGAEIRCATPAYLLAMKLEAFLDRGGGDFLSSKDFADIVALVDGRPELIAEVKSSPVDLQRFVADQFRHIMGDPESRARQRFMTGLYGAAGPGAASQRRIDSVVFPRITKISTIG